MALQTGAMQCACREIYIFSLAQLKDGNVFGLVMSALLILRISCAS